jgi:hypothetical protein
MPNKSKVPYSDRPDTVKLKTQWNKIRGIITRDREWSAAIVRAATAAEIAANIAIRNRFEADSQFSADFVNSLLKWANGIDGKIYRLLIPSEPDQARKDALSELAKDVKVLNEKRNEIVHRGVFASKEEAERLVILAHGIILGLVRPWEPELKLSRPKFSKVPNTKPA